MSRKLAVFRDAWEDRAAQLLRRLPGGSIAAEQLERLEQNLLAGLKQRLDKLEQRHVYEISTGAAKAADAAPAELLQNLLARSLEQDREQSRDEFYRRILREMVPDEARILSAVSDGSAHALVHVAGGSRLAGSAHRLAENISNVGRAAGLQCLELVPTYISRLRTWGLLETGPEDESMRTQYEILETDSEVRRVRDQLKGSLVRRTLRISAFGRKLWSDCQPAGESGSAAHDES